MPLIEVLPNSTNTAAAPGWAYVPDTGYDPSKAPIQPTGARQRGARNTAVADGQEKSVKQQNAIVKRLAELDKDNYRDVQIAVPSRQGGGSGRGARKTITPAVRRILQSQKTFVNHLADEEAQLAHQHHAPTPQLVQTPSQPINPSGRRPSTKAKRTKSVSMAPVTPHAQPSLIAALPPPSRRSSLAAPAPSSFPMPTGDEANPLLRTYTSPRPPSPILDELLSAPPLPYAAARSKPSTLGHPPRRFCEICGYWGKVKCLKCGARVCGLDCKRTHDDHRCPRFFA